MAYPIYKYWNIIYRIDSTDEDVKIFTFSSRYDAKRLYDYIKEKYFKNIEEEEVEEAGDENKGDMCCWYNKGEYLYVRLVGQKPFSPDYIKELI